jgi:hypothetical protein
MERKKYGVTSRTPVDRIKAKKRRFSFSFFGEFSEVIVPAYSALEPDPFLRSPRGYNVIPCQPPTKNHEKGPTAE